MRFPLAASAAVIVAVAIAACSGGQPSTYINPPTAAAAAPAAGPLTINGTGQTQSGGSAGGVSSVLTYTGGGGVVTAASSAAPPAGTIAVTPADRIRVEASPSATSPNVYYLTISSAAGATLTTLPGVNLTLTSPAVGTYQEAQFTNGKWNNVVTSSSNGNTTGVGATSVSFAPSGKAISIPAGGSIFLAFYQGSFPAPTPPGQIVNTVLADPSFESSPAPLGSTVTSTGWTVCTISAAASTSATPAPSRPFSTFTPTPGTLPAATISAAGTTVPQGTGSPTPTQNTVPVNSGKSAAVFGAVFSNFTAANFAYNGLCQQVKLPANPQGELSVFANGTENNLAFLGFEVNVLDTNGKWLANLVDENQIALMPPGDSAYRTVILPATQLAPFGGQTVQIFVGIWTKAGTSTGSTTFSGYYFVDDFNMAGS